MFTSFESVATISLGYKSLQNGFFYINQATIDTYGIEKRFLVPILMLRDLDSTSYHQKAKNQLWLFHCREEERDLRGTGARRYIEAMADVSAAEKKQTGKSQTMREALEAQGGGLWYAPKARPNRHHVWIRKAFDGVFAPFIFETAALVDQRCNSVTADDGITWEEMGAVLTSTLFAYSVEINGSASMGAGALEAPTTKLRSYPVLDISELKKQQRQKIVSLARAVWASEAPVDWSNDTYSTGASLQKLDQWMIDLLGTSVTLQTLYRDLHEVCQSRILTAKDKTKKTKKKKTENIGNVADAIAKGIEPQIKGRNFPEDFVDAPLDMDFHLSRELVKSIQIAQLLDRLDITFHGDGGRTLLEGTYVKPVAEGIVRAVLWGRSSFKLSSDRNAMEAAVTNFLTWIDRIETEIKQAITDSALGTGYEEQLSKEVFVRLGINHLAGVKALPARMST